MRNAPETRYTSEEEWAREFERAWTELRAAGRAQMRSAEIYETALRRFEEAGSQHAEATRAFHSAVMRFATIATKREGPTS